VAVLDSQQGVFKAALSRVAVIKNQLLAFVIVISVVLNASAISLDHSQERFQKVGGTCMHLSTVLITVLFGVFYCYALFRLPGSQQELIFDEHGRKMAAEFRKDEMKRKKTP